MSALIAKRERAKERAQQREQAQMRAARFNPVERAVLIFLVFPAWWLSLVIFVPAMQSVWVLLGIDFVVYPALVVWTCWRSGFLCEDRG